MNYPQAQSVYQCFLALKLGMREFEKAGDVYGDFGCGTGGPTRMIAQFSGAKIVAVNINKMHLEQLAMYNQEVSDKLYVFFSYFFLSCRRRLRIGSRRTWRTITRRAWRANRSVAFICASRRPARSTTRCCAARCFECSSRALASPALTGR
jgi:hypothetical protein